MVSSSMPSANAVARAWNAAGREWVDEWGFSCFACGRWEPEWEGCKASFRGLTDAGYAVVQLPGVVVETEDEHTQYGCRSVASWVGRTSYDQGRTYEYNIEVETTTEVYTSGLSPHEARCHAAVLLAAAAAADAAAEEVR